LHEREAFLQRENSSIFPFFTTLLYENIMGRLKKNPAGKSEICKQGAGISFWAFPPCLPGHPDP